jgi:hypothetical protein
MKGFKVIVFGAVAAMTLATVPLKTAAQDVVEPTIAPIAETALVSAVAPECPYGYYDYAPYNCVPDGYYGSEWFKGGAFVGAGPWFHGSEDFQGSVDNRLDPQHGYKGAMPKAGEKAATERKDPTQFKGNEKRDGRGHTTVEKG